MAKEKEMTLEEKLNEAIVADVPYEVPKNWVWVKIGGITVEIKNGTTAKQNKSGDGIKVTRIESIQNNSIDLNRLGTIAEMGKLKENDYYKDGDIALSHINSAEHVGKTALINKSILPLVHGMNLLRIRVNKRLIYPQFIQFYTRGYDYKIEITKRINMAVNQVSLNQKNLADIPLPLPPLNEQQRIVDRIVSIFEKLDRAEELIEEVRDGFQKRKSSILEKAFRGKLTEKWRKENNKLQSCEERFLNIKENRLSLVSSNKEKKDMKLLFENYKFKDESLPSGWMKLKSSMICELITCGKTPTGKIAEKGDIPYLKVYNIVNNKINFDYKPQFIDYEIHTKKLKSSILKPNDVVMNIVGPPLRKIAIIPSTYDNWNMNQAIVRFRTIKCVNYKFFYYCLIYDETLKKVIDETRGVVGQANISITQSRNLDILLPPLEEQQEIVRILDKLLGNESKIEELTQLEEQIELIKKSILAKAFRGKLGTNCEEDGTAVELLKEILSKN